jgi:hypothetical protein
MLVTSHDRIKKLFDEGKTEQEVLASEATGRSRRDVGQQRAARRRSTRNVYPVVQPAVATASAWGGSLAVAS